jgi:hypothetical protein
MTPTFDTYGRRHQLLDAIEQGDAHSAEQLLPLVYDELRKLAVDKMRKTCSSSRRNMTARIEPHESALSP